MAAEAELSPGNVDQPTTPAVTEQEIPKPGARRRPWLLFLLLLFNLVLLGNIYLLIKLFEKLAR